MTDKLLSTGAVADILNIDRRTVWSRVKAGTLKPAMKLDGVNGAYLFKPADVTDLAADRAVK